MILVTISCGAPEEDDDPLSQGGVCGSEAPNEAGPFSKLSIVGDTPVNGIYDPAIIYDSDGSNGWMAYTAISGGKVLLSTHLAHSTDNGTTWTHEQIINTSFTASITGNFCSGAPCAAGSWIYEVPTITYDPTDAGKEYKIYSHKYFKVGADTRVPQTFSIVYTYATDPTGFWSTEEILFGAGSLPAEGGSARIDLNSIDTSLAGVEAYTEPGIYQKNGILYMNLTTLESAGLDRKLILIKSDDHGTNWDYVGVMADETDAENLCDLHLDGAAMFEEGGKDYMLLTPTKDEIEYGYQFRGTYVIEVENLALGHLKINSFGQLDVIKFIPAQETFDTSGHGAGQGTYHKYNTGGGILVPQINVDDVPEFAQIFTTNVFPLD